MVSARCPQPHSARAGPRVVHRAPCRVLLLRSFNSGDRMFLRLSAKMSENLPCQTYPEGLLEMIWYMGVMPVPPASMPTWLMPLIVRILPAAAAEVVHPWGFQR